MNDFARVQMLRRQIETLVKAHEKAREEAAAWRARIDAAQLLLVKAPPRAATKVFKEAIWQALAGTLV